MKQFEAGESIRAGAAVCIKDDGKVYNVPKPGFCEQCETCEYLETAIGIRFPTGEEWPSYICNSPKRKKLVRDCGYKKKGKPDHGTLEGYMPAGEGVYTDLSKPGINIDLKPIREAIERQRKRINETIREAMLDNLDKL